MRNTRTLLATWMIFFCGSDFPLAAQGTDGPVAVEAAAARAMLSRDGIPSGPVALNPSYAAAGVAPGHSAGKGDRPAARSQVVARLLNARVARLEDVRRCPTATPGCPLSDAAVVLHLSEPTIAGDTATITVTALYNTGFEQTPVVYETVEYTLVRRGATWSVAKAVQLGIS